MSYKGEAAHPSAPTVAKVRMRFAKRGRARFSSHRDVARAMEWALRRAGVPVSLSQGFSPHPRLSWIGASPTGAASEAEFVEIGLTADLDPSAVAREVGAVLPEGLVVLDVVRSGPGALADRIDGSSWRIELPGVDPADLRDAVAALLDSDVVEVERMTKNGPRTLDVRSALVSVLVEDPPAGSPRGAVDDVTETHDERHPNDEPTADDTRPTRPSAITYRRTHAPSAVCGTLSAVVRHTTPAVRPDDVVNALRIVAGLEPPVPVRSTRTAQGRLDDDGALLDPLEADRDPIGR
ncbi:TIGR03936 family radical SAM-associated protein [Actinomycetospora sp. CA-084318]|uniref:TIGR03936 family radical SAM-associated protein n=1 Tax=Actinomycetospora sp. CA-084318 TaxID=3239892 RepID=UPI003D998AB5